jgi:DNA-binding MarR family transcriptional regulator
MIDAGRDAALHILERGRIPLLEIEVLRALWRRGGGDRELAEKLHVLTGRVVA